MKISPLFGKVHLVHRRNVPSRVMFCLVSKLNTAMHVQNGTFANHEIWRHGSKFSKLQYFASKDTFGELSSRKKNFSKTYSFRVNSKKTKIRILGN